MARVKDLSAVEHSATSTYIDILPKLESIKASDVQPNVKLEQARDLVIKSLCEARAASEHSYVDNSGNSNIGYEISQDYIVNVRMSIYRCRTIDQIISRVKASIENGKNYNKENKQ